MTIILTLLLSFCIIGLGYLFYLQQQTFEKQRSDDKTFFKEVMNRLMARDSTDYLVLKGEKLPEEESPVEDEPDPGIDLDKAEASDFIRKEEPDKI